MEIPDVFDSDKIGSIFIDGSEVISDGGNGVIVVASAREKQLV